MIVFVKIYFFSFCWRHWNILIHDVTYLTKKFNIVCLGYFYFFCMFYANCEVWFIMPFRSIWVILKHFENELDKICYPWVYWCCIEFINMCALSYWWAVFLLASFWRQDCGAQRLYSFASCVGCFIKQRLDLFCCGDIEQSD